METFKVNKNISIVCNYGKTRNGFKHEAKLIENGHLRDFAKVCYLNRTWESFKYETVIDKLLRGSDILTQRQKTIFMKRQKGEYHKAVKSQFAMIGTIAQMGNLLTDTQKEQNDWKTRMLKAGLGGQGLIMPDDWDTLPEDEKQKRLDNVINELNK